MVLAAAGGRGRVGNGLCGVWELRWHDRPAGRLCLSTRRRPATPQMIFHTIAWSSTCSRLVSLRASRLPLSSGITGHFCIPFRKISRNAAAAMDAARLLLTGRLLCNRGGAPVAVVAPQRPTSGGDIWAAGHAASIVPFRHPEAHMAGQAYRQPGTHSAWRRYSAQAALIHQGKLLTSSAMHDQGPRTLRASRK